MNNLKNKSNDSYRDFSEISLSEFQEDMKKIYSELDISESINQNDSEPMIDGESLGEVVFWMGRS